jgi:ABC transport system ATP-binding/permease protein
VFGNFNQEGLAYKEDKRAIEYVKDMAEYFPLADGTKLSASMFMEKFGFNAQQQFTPLSKLSGGEKRRLHLMSVLFVNPNFLILDEPTNDLDLQTLRTLEEFLMDFPGCILIVSHDRYFMDRMVEHLFAFEGEGVIKDFPGNYTQYRSYLKEIEAGTRKDDGKMNMVSVEEKVVAPVETTTTTNVAKKLSFKEKSELESLDKEIPALQKEKETLELKMSENIPYEEIQKIGIKVNEIIAALDEKEMRWLELSERS